MNIFDKLQKQYQEIDNNYSKKEFLCHSKGYSKKEAELREKRELNDHAYFLFMFTRLEDIVREESSKLISKKQKTLTSWKQKRVWYILPTEKESDEIHFKKRLALLVDKSSHHYARVVDYYALRNIIAHGGKFSTPISIPTVVGHMKGLCSILKA